MNQIGLLSVILLLLDVKIPNNVVYYDILKDIIMEHPDYNNSDMGIYEYGCGLDKLNITFGHDEYLYQVLQQNNDKHRLSEKYMNIIRYHSFIHGIQGVIIIVL